MGLWSWSLIENIKSSSEHFTDNLKLTAVYPKFIHRKSLPTLKILILLDYIYPFSLKYIPCNNEKKTSHYQLPSFPEDTQIQTFSWSTFDQAKGFSGLSAASPQNPNKTTWTVPPFPSAHHCNHCFSTLNDLVSSSTWISRSLQPGSVSIRLLLPLLCSQLREGQTEHPVPCPSFMVCAQGWGHHSASRAFPKCSPSLPSRVCHNPIDLFSVVSFLQPVLLPPFLIPVSVGQLLSSC